MQPPTLQPLGDAAIVVTFGADVSDAVNDRVMALAASLARDPLTAHVRDVVPGFASLVVHIDPREVRVEEVMAPLSVRARRAADVMPGKAVELPLREIRVRYGGADGPDLRDVAAFAGVTEAEVVRRHTAPVYRVYMLGFMPGFAYLGRVDAAIAAPRRAAPRERVPAGSVGIAGIQTGVYPQDAPGGWQIIGVTAEAMFDRATGVSLLGPGDRVRFIDEAPS